MNADLTTKIFQAHQMVQWKSHDALDEDFHAELNGVIDGVARKISLNKQQFLACTKGPATEVTRAFSMSSAGFEPSRPGMLIVKYEQTEIDHEAGLGKEPCVAKSKGSQEWHWSLKTDSSSGKEKVIFKKLLATEEYTTEFDGAPLQMSESSLGGYPYSYIQYERRLRSLQSE